MNQKCYLLFCRPYTVQDPQSKQFLCFVICPLNFIDGSLLKSWISTPSIKPAFYGSQIKNYHFLFWLYFVVYFAFLNSFFPSKKNHLLTFRSKRIGRAWLEFLIIIFKKIFSCYDISTHESIDRSLLCLFQVFSDAINCTKWNVNRTHPFFLKQKQGNMAMSIFHFHTQCYNHRI